MRPGKIFNVNINFPVGITSLLAVIILGLTAGFFILTSSWKDTFIFFAAALAAGAAVATAFYTGNALNMALEREDAIRERESALDDLSRKQLALRFSERWSDPRMHYARDVCRQVYDHRGKEAAEVIAFASGEKVKTNITNTLNFFEEMAFSIDYEIADPELVKEQFCGVVTTIFSILKPWIDQERVNRGRPKIWIRVEDLFTKWC